MSTSATDRELRHICGRDNRSTSLQRVRLHTDLDTAVCESTDRPRLPPGPRITKRNLRSRVHPLPALATTFWPDFRLQSP
jgi:hypothetical protein